MAVDGSRTTAAPHATRPSGADHHEPHQAGWLDRGSGSGLSGRGTDDDDHRRGSLHDGRRPGHRNLSHVVLWGAKEMKRWASFRVYSCAIVFAVWAVLWALDIRSRVLVVLFLSLAAASFVIS